MELFGDERGPLAGKAGPSLPSGEGAVLLCPPPPAGSRRRHACVQCEMCVEHMFARACLRACAVWSHYIWKHG
eukprot:2657327-Lingulodinium_polyedra.AAC.1